MSEMCCRCYDMVDELFDANCDEKPDQLPGAPHTPLGMYRCPDCGAMVLANIPHPPMCARCIAREHPAFD